MVTCTTNVKCYSFYNVAHLYTKQCVLIKQNCGNMLFGGAHSQQWNHYLRPLQVFLLSCLVQKIPAMTHLASLSQKVAILSFPSLAFGTLKKDAKQQKWQCCDLQEKKNNECNSWIIGAQWIILTHLQHNS